MDLDYDAIGEFDGVGGLVLDQPFQHRDGMEETGDIPLKDTGLLPIRGDQHHDAPLALGQDVSVISKARQEDR